MSIDKKIIIKTYKETGSVWKTGKLLGICGQYVHEVLVDAKENKHINIFSDEDKEFLKINYLKYRDNGELNKLASLMGRTKQFLCRKAKELGLTDKSRKVTYSEEHRENISKKRIEYYKGNEHPRGMLGKKFTQQQKETLSKIHKESWANPNSVFNTDEFRQKKSDIMHKLRMSGSFNSYSKGKVIESFGYRFKSSWEYNVATKLEMFKKNGQIKHWEYESTHFDFPDSKRGIRSYCPDFKVVNNNSTNVYLEVKGWYREHDKERMLKFIQTYPSETLIIIDKRNYEDFVSEANNTWGYSFKSERISDNQH